MLRDICLRLILSFLLIRPYFAQSSGAPSAPEIPKIPSTDSSSDIEAEPEKTEPALSAEEKQAEIAAAADEKKRKADFASVYPIFKGLIQASNNENESTLNKSKQEKRQAALLKKLNEQYQGKILTIELAVVGDVKPETRLTKAGEKKIQAAKKKLMNSREMRQARAIYGDDFLNNPLFALMLWPLIGSCKNCTEETGRYNAEYRLEIQIPRPTEEGDGENTDMSTEPLNVKIVTVIESEKKATRLRPESTVRVRGSIAGLEYDKYSGAKIYLFEE